MQSAMSETFDYTLDPRGDTKIILLTPNAPFAAGFEEDEDEDEDEKEEEEQPTDQVTFRVSSRHLDLASERSRRKRSELWGDEQVHDDGFIHMEYQEWSTMALLVVLNIVHSRNRKVPKAVSLEMLAKIAVIVDYFEFHEAVEPFSISWINKLWPDRPQTYCRDLVLWTWVSHVFDDHKLAGCKAIAALSSSAAVEDLGLPIPPSILGEIVNKRERVKTFISGRLTQLRRDFETTKSLDYGFQSRCIMMGALYLHFRQYGMFGAAVTKQGERSVYATFCGIHQKAADPALRDGALRIVGDAVGQAVSEIRAYIFSNLDLPVDLVRAINSRVISSQR